MEAKERSRLVVGLLFVILGVIFLLTRFFPALESWLAIEFTWPLIVVGVGLFLLIIGLLVGTPDMAVPACVVGGIGGLLYWQNATNNWGSWAYVWTLIPGFVGVGIIISGLLNRSFRRGLREGGGLLVISLILFLIFGSFLGGAELIGPYWPIILILFGLWLIFRAFYRR
jgi:hypothetical protein